MKLKRYLAMMLLAATSAGLMSSCSDDADLGQAPRLFRPIASLETSNNTITATWDNISGATQYNLTLYRVSGTNEAGDNTYEQVTTATCESSPYTFTDLAWDEKYKVDINCAGASISSKTYETKDVSVAYPTSLKSVKTIDNAARITWDLSGSTIRAIIATPEDGGDAIIQTVSSSQYQSGSVDVIGLASSTKYTFTVYSDTEEYVNATYAGKITGTTSKPIDFDTEYGAGMWLDIRDYPDKQAVDTLKTADFWAQVTDGMTIILRGDFNYKVNNSQAINKSVRFVTASTLGGNARFISSGALTLAKNVTVDFLEFVNVDFISDKAMPGGGNEIATNTDKGFGGRQVFNVNGTSSTLKKISFKGGSIEGYRAMVRAQQATDAVQEIVVEDCVINGIGDQGVFTTTNKAADWQTITMKNCTVTNIVMLGDLRATAGDLTVNIENCTFCYAPIGTTANANTPMLRFNGNKNTVKLNVMNTLFGPAMESGGGSDAIVTNTAATMGSVFINPATTTLASVSKSFKTNFGWAEIGNNAATYPLDGLQELSMDETKLWSNPAGGEFRIIANLDESGIGDSRWW